jgi:hypothetical protein
MTFSFNAVGTKAEVIAQVEATPTYDNAIGEQAKALIIEALKADKAEAGPNYEYRYTVSVSGHSGGSIATSIQLTMAAHYIPVIKV